MAHPATRVIGNDRIELGAATGFGPRIVSLVPAGGPNLFAELGDFGIDLADGRRYRFRGGHRLWVAPEVPEITYAPDDGDVLWSEDERSISVTGTTGGIEKTISARLESRSVEVDHAIKNLGSEPIDLAPWAITQFPPGGTALLPLDRDAADRHGLQASHAIAGWPYTDWGALRYNAGAAVILVDGDRTTPTKIGTSLARGWMAYVRDGWVFTKHAHPAPGSPIDRGAQAEVYASAAFVELETLGGLLTLEPGEAATHKEVWRVERAPEKLDDVPAFVESFEETP